MKQKLILFILSFVLIFFASSNIMAWDSFTVPRVIAGGSVGYFRISLDDFGDFYESRWNNIYTGQVNVRVYRTNYLTVQYARYQNDVPSGTFKTNNANANDLSWDERFVNVGLRWYSYTDRRVKFYSSVGLTFIEIKETPGMSVFQNSSSFEKSGSGFFGEIGADITIIPHVAIFLEFEISTAGEGGTPGFIGQSVGGYAFQAGIDLYF